MDNMIKQLKNDFEAGRIEKSTAFNKIMNAYGLNFIEVSRLWNKA